MAITVKSAAQNQVVGLRLADFCSLRAQRAYYLVPGSRFPGVKSPFLRNAFWPIGPVLCPWRTALKLTTCRQAPPEQIPAIQGVNSPRLAWIKEGCRAGRRLIRLQSPNSLVAAIHVHL